MLVAWVPEYAQADDIVEKGVYPKSGAFVEEITEPNVFETRTSIEDELQDMYERHMRYAEALASVTRTRGTPKVDRIIDVVLYEDPSPGHWAPFYPCLIEHDAVRDDVLASKRIVVIMQPPSPLSPTLSLLCR